MQHNRPRTPIKIILPTVAITALLTWGVLHLTGYHAPHGGPPAPGTENLMGDAAPQLWTCGMHPWIITEEPGLCPICNMDLVPKRDDGSADADTGEREIVYWRAPMDPTEIYDQPGKSKMGMDLVPVYEDEIQGGVEIKIDPVTRQNMGVRTAAAEKAPLRYTIRTYGHVTYDETLTALINPKVSGWLEHLFVNFTGEIVEKGQPLFDIYSPELVAAQEEYLTAFRNYKRMGNNNLPLLESARRRLTYFDVAESEIEALEASESVRKTILIRSPVRGVVTHKNAVEGGYIRAGTSVFTVADLSRVWVEAHIYEYELGWVKKGQKARMTLPYLPGKVFEGRVAYVYPYLQQKTRDVVVRLEFENPEYTLKPEMYADVYIETGGEKEGIVIPSEAVIRSGERNVVFVAKGGGKFSPRDATLGMAVDGGKVQVLSGLTPGEPVVVSGQFLLDSESKLKEAVQKMMAAQQSPAEKKPAKDDFFQDMESTSEDDFFEDMK